MITVCQLLVVTLSSVLGEITGFTEGILVFVMDLLSPWWSIMVDNYKIEVIDSFCYLTLTLPKKETNYNSLKE